MCASLDLRASAVYSSTRGKRGKQGNNGGNGNQHGVNGGNGDNGSLSQSLEGYLKYRSVTSVTPVSPVLIPVPSVVPQFAPCDRAVPAISSVPPVTRTTLAALPCWNAQKGGQPWHRSTKSPRTCFASPSTSRSSICSSTTFSSVTRNRCCFTPACERCFPRFAMPSPGSSTRPRCGGLAGVISRSTNAAR